MRLLSKEELNTLIHNHGNPAVSVYMPTHRVGEVEQDRIRLRNLLRETEDHLIGYGLRIPDARSLLGPARQLLDDSHFWQYLSDGLALFLSAGLYRYYRVPISFPELAVVAQRFHIKPLIPLFSENGVFYVLALSQGQARLLQCTRHSVREVTPSGVPTNLAEALRYDQPAKQHQFHTTGPGGMTVSHGHGVSKDYDKVSILRYFQQVDRGLHEVLKDEHAPLVIAAVDYLHPIYREANRYRNLLDEGLEGSPDELSEKTLQERAWPVVQPHFERGRAEALQRYDEAAATGLATSEVKQAVLAAYDGRIDTLFVAAGVQQWGHFDPETRKVRLYEEKAPGLEDLLDFAAAHTLTKDGTVYSRAPDQLSGQTQIAAILRY